MVITNDDMFNNNVDMYLMSPPPLIIHRSSDVCLLLNIGLHCILILHREAVRVCSLSLALMVAQSLARHNNNLLMHTFSCCILLDTSTDVFSMQFYGCVRSAKNASTMSLTLCISHSCSLSISHGR